MRRAAAAVEAADALLIGAGAGMGVDSGLPDFRGNQGFWQAYPPYRKLGLDFYSLANPRWFESDPTLAWGFYGHRLNLYCSVAPHDGFRILLSWARRLECGAHVFTSNVDGHFQKAGFAPESVAEVHGSIHWMQCTRNCGADVFTADDKTIRVDEETMRASEPLPSCPSCGMLARPNILMFSDAGWDDRRQSGQMTRLNDWLERVRGKRLVAVECGAGTAVPTVRRTCEAMAEESGGVLVRINAREPSVPHGHIGLATGALDALRAIDSLLPKAKP